MLSKRNIPHRDVHDSKVTRGVPFGGAELIAQDASAYEETLDAIRGIQRGLDGMKAGTGKPFRACHKIPRRMSKN